MEIRDLKNELGEIVQFAMRGLLETPATVYQPYGPPAAFDVNHEIFNATRAWVQAVGFAMNEGDPTLPCTKHEMVKHEWLYPGGERYFRNCRPDLIVLLRDDFDPRKNNIAGSVPNSLIKDSFFGSILAESYMECRTKIFPEETKSKVTPAQEIDRLIGALLWSKANLPSLVQHFLPQIVAIIDKVLAPRPLATSMDASSSQPAWLQNTEIIDVLLAALALPDLENETVIRPVFLTHANRLLRANAAAAGALKARLPVSRPFDLKLPGDLVVESIFGEATFDRGVPEFSAQFGGRLSFPGLNNAYFEILQGSFDTHFNFALNAQVGSILVSGVELIHSNHWSRRSLSRMSPPGRNRLSTPSCFPAESILEISVCKSRRRSAWRRNSAQEASSFPPSASTTTRWTSRACRKSVHRFPWRLPGGEQRAELWSARLEVCFR